MYSKTPTGKNPKGSVGIENFRGRLRLRLPRSLYEGKQKYLTTELLDTREGWEAARAIQGVMEADVEAGEDRLIPPALGEELITRPMSLI